MMLRGLQMSVLSGLLFLLGCSSEVEPKSHLDAWDKIDLPEVVWAPSIVDVSPLAVEIALDRDLRISINSQAMSVEELSAALIARYKRYGEFPVIIGAHRGLTVENVWPVVKTCREMGLWRINYAVYQDKAEQLISYVEFAAPIREGADAKGPVIFKDATHEDVLRVGVRRDGFTFQDSDKLATEQQVDRQLGRLSRMVESVSVICIPESDATHGQVARLLGICSRYGLSSIAVMPSHEFDVKEETASQ